MVFAVRLKLQYSCAEEGSETWAMSQKGEGNVTMHIYHVDLTNKATWPKLLTISTKTTATHILEFAVYWYYTLKCAVDNPKLWWEGIECNINVMKLRINIPCIKISVFFCRIQEKQRKRREIRNIYQIILHVTPITKCHEDRRKLKGKRYDVVLFDCCVFLSEWGAVVGQWLMPRTKWYGFKSWSPRIAVLHTVNDLINANFQKNASYLINAPWGVKFVLGTVHFL